MPGFKVAEQQP